MLLRRASLAVNELPPQRGAFRGEHELSAKTLPSNYLGREFLVPRPILAALFSSLAEGADYALAPWRTASWRDSTRVDSLEQLAGRRRRNRD